MVVDLDTKKKGPLSINGILGHFSCYFTKFIALQSDVEERQRKNR
jgi:hypothetical protein